MMVRIAVYDIATGVISRLVRCPEESAGHQAGSGQAAAVVGPEVSDATHKIENGAPVPL